MSSSRRRGGAREAAAELATAPRAVKDAALRAMADALVARTAEILTANAADVARAREPGTAEAMLDRLAPRRRRGWPRIADGLRQVAGLPDPVGEVVRGSTLPNGLELRQVRVPFGVVGIIYEARPNVTVDAAGSASSPATRCCCAARPRPASNAALVAVLRDALAGDRAAGRRGAAGARPHPRLGQGADAGPRAGRRADPARRRVADPHGGRGVDGAGDRDRRRQLPRLRRRRRRPGHGGGDPAQRQDAAARRSATRPSRCWCTPTSPTRSCRRRWRRCRGRA